jgi:hypothetical protein
MNKLETITELLVNELSTFSEDVQKLKKELDRAETIKVQFNVEPIENSILQLGELQQSANLDSEKYYTRLSKKIRQAKIYPKWAVIGFIVAVLISFGALFFSYHKHLTALENEKTAYEKGKNEATEYISLYFSENPSALKSYKKWAESK